MDRSPNRNAAGMMVTVSASARLHLGFLDLNGDLGRSFGSLGLSLDQPRTILSLSRGDAPRLAGPESERAGRYLALLARHLGLASPYDLTIIGAMPPHAGLGSGTQLALAVSAALRTLHGLPLDPAGDAVVLGRGGRSGIGIGVFATGGVVVDGGRGPATKIPPILARLTFPADWRVVLVFDPACEGAPGAAETIAFQELPPMSAADAADVCRLVLMQALPALAERDIAGFGRAVRTLQRRLGRHFAPRQGGAPFTSPAVAAALDLLDAAGAHGTGQSSWGPTGFAFAPDGREAERLAHLLRTRMPERGLEIRVTTGLDRGADITLGVAAPHR